MLRLFDTALSRVTDLTLHEPGQVSMYVCGPTVYADPHIGHGRFALVFDVLWRYLEWSGYEVRYVSNITDIEDKIIRKSVEESRPYEEIVEQYEGSWWEALDRLGCRRPHAAPHATGYVEQMATYITELIDRGRAYETSDGVYFVVETVEDYGLLARQSLDSLRAGAGGRETFTEEKRSLADFALWKKAKPGEPSWPSPWGPGRPGWHIECTVMALDLLGDGFDIHGGGIDLAFPHHENERAQAVGGAHRFATHWVHNGMVTDEGGRKMGKSEGNAVSLLELLDRVDPRAYRLLVLAAHYQSPLVVNERTMTDATAGLDRLDGFARRFPRPSVAAAPLVEGAVEAFRAAMDDDLDTAGALAGVFDLVRKANAAADGGDEGGAASAAATVWHLVDAFGLELAATGADDDIDDETRALMAERDAARAGKDWGHADALRDQLAGRGWVVEDTPAGTVVHR